MDGNRHLGRQASAKIKNVLVIDATGAACTLKIDKTEEKSPHDNKCGSFTQ